MSISKIVTYFELSYFCYIPIFPLIYNKIATIKRSCSICGISILYKYIILILKKILAFDYNSLLFLYLFKTTNEAS